MLGLPQDVSVHGATIDSLIGYVHILMLVLFIGWGAFYIYVLMRFRQGKNPKADYHGAKTHASSYLEGTIALVEAVLLVGFSIPIYARVVAALPNEKDAVVVRVVAQQFMWNFQYTGADGKFGKIDLKQVDPVSNPNGLDTNDPNAKDDFFSAVEMHVPANKPVIVRITSRDVIHSFGVPNLRIKQDAIPGMDVPQWFEATTPGQYDIACSQLCGDGHYSMKGTLVVDTPDAYTQWASGQTPEAVNIQSMKNM